MEKKKIQTNKAPAAIGPYSQAIKVGNFIYTAGQIALKPDGSDLFDRPAGEQTEQVLENIGAVLGAAGSSLSKVVKTTVYLINMNEFVEINKVYGDYFAEPFPARSTVQVAALPRGAKVEIEAVAVK